MRAAYVLAAFLLLTPLLAGCSSLNVGGIGGIAGLGGNQNTNQYYDPTQMKYFQGTNGVEAVFNQLPSTIYYDGTSVTSSTNTFPFTVEVQDFGASYTRGGVFISGYDPNLIMIDQIPIANTPAGACSIQLGDYSLNNLGVVLQCGNNVQLTARQCDSSAGLCLNSAEVSGQTWFQNSILKNLVFGFQQTGAGGMYSLSLNNMNYSYDQGEHGLILIAILAGLSFQDFLGQEFILAGNTYSYPGGEMNYISYTGHVLNWPQGTDEIPQTFQLTTCYMYTTFAAPMVCIDPQPYSGNRKVCTPQTSTWSGGEGAPIAITQVTQENTPQDAIFHVTIKNLGGGTVYDPGSLEKCSPYYIGGAKMTDQNVVWIGEVRIGNYLMNPTGCSPGQEVRLQNGEAEFTCTYPIRQYAQINSAYQTPLVIELWYGYSKVYQQQVLVKAYTSVT